jgi:uncharacterized repeat protein (TIGR03803 family)
MTSTQMRSDRSISASVLSRFSQAQKIYYLLAAMTCALVSPGAAQAQSPTFSTLYSFGSSGGTDGVDPVAGLISDSSGALYGATYYGGTSGHGTIFKLAPPAVSGGA